MAALGADIAADLLAIEVPERVVRVIRLPQPAAGADPAPVVVPGGSIWIPLSLTGVLTTGATPASRVPVLSLDDGTTVVEAWRVGWSFSSDTVVRVTFSAGGFWDHGSAIGGQHDVGIPLRRAYPGWRLVLATVDLQADDQWSQLALQVVDVSTGHAERELRRQLAQAAGLLPEYPGEEVQIP
jgi:hypothetical protein